jgi:peptidoglycan/xylan/chitin deacetylase (PgdA/CDA1 family)
MIRAVRPSLAALALSLAWGATPNVAVAGDCPGNPDAIGTSRTIVVDPTEHPRIGAMNYPETLPLAEKEVVLTFDDGPIAPYTGNVLDILASQCVHATYFIVGEMARTRPELVRRAYREGHTIATHSMTHPYAFKGLPFDKAKAQIEDGIEATSAALGDSKSLAPFFRFPGFGRTDKAEDYAASRGLMVWSADVPADDWMHISDREITRRALMRLEHKGRGVLLLHDIHPATVLALPVLLKELKARGFHIVHVVPASADHPKTETTAEAWLVPNRRKPALPVLTLAEVQNLNGDFLAQHPGADLCTPQAMSPKSFQRSRNLAARAPRHFSASRRFAHARSARSGRWFAPMWY